MKLTIVIVNYNVKDFLEQCLNSVRRAVNTIDAEVFIVDNQSADSSCEMVKNKFPEFILIENKENVGFSRANNQAMRLAKGEYILLLNPDTIVEEDTFIKTIAFMDQQPECGGLGVKMIDGNGHFLPESKRALPTPTVAFYKIFGLSKLFPNSKRFGQYHLSFLDKNQTHEVEILSGAFMLMRKTALDKVGLLDETFFMYGEDIDLSYRIIQGGYKNYYFPDTTIIHYKGESTKKGSLNYVKTFYNAMIIFAEKHFGQSAKYFIILIRFAVYLRALIALIKRIFHVAFIQVLDFITLILGLELALFSWEHLHFFHGYYPQSAHYIFPIISAIFVGSIYISGGYDQPVKMGKLIRGIGIASLIALASYALLDETVRFSRMLILSSISWAFIALPLYRKIFHSISSVPFSFRSQALTRFLIVGELTETERVHHILKHAVASPVVEVYQTANGLNSLFSKNNSARIAELIRIQKIDEVIFCAKNIESSDIISLMLDLNHLNCDFKIASPDSVTVVGSHSANTNGDLYQINLNLITTEENIRNKRLFDLTASILLLLSYPILVFINQNPIKLFKNLFAVMMGHKTMVGFDNQSVKHVNLPLFKNSLIHVEQALDYAKNYSIEKDFLLVFKGLKKLGQ